LQPSRFAAGAVKPCNVQGNLRCPYHSWTYKLDGSLKSTPHFGGYYKDSYDGFDRDSKGLQADSL
jgi:choline monooxygenase